MTSELVGKHALLNSADDQLDPFLYRLYGHYERVCMEAPDGVCRQGTRELATICRMSVGKVVSVRRELSERGFITLKPGVGDQPFETCIAECSPHEQQPVQEVNGSIHEQDAVHPMNASVHAVHVVNTSVPSGDTVHPTNTETPLDSRVPQPDLESFKAFKDQELKNKDKKAAAAGAREDESSPEPPRIYAVYVENMRQQITPIVRDKLVDAVKEFGEQWVEDAIVEAVTHNAKTWAYVETVLDSWGKKGRDTPRPSSVRGAGLKPAAPVEIRKRPAELEGLNVREMIEKGNFNAGWLPPIVGDEDTSDAAKSAS